MPYPLIGDRVTLETDREGKIVRRHITVLMGCILLIGTACNSGDTSDRSGPVANDPVSDSEVNRYRLIATGEIELDHGGGLLCKVEDGSLMLDFSIDAYDGPVQYSAVFSGFAPELNGFDGVFTLADAAGTAEGEAAITFSYGDPPEGYQGVVRAAGDLTGSIAGSSGSANISGTYACFLMNSEVGL